ncbi:hypothetical protein GALL_458870 [mine drainage metagenome]|uniref:Uncharacterized protein n=1 Tax=mine drainage metagenome TaxID=410659 RepID=A0A1J5PXF1_9ZZZZ
MVAAPDALTRLPLNVLALLLHWLGVAPLPVMVPVDETVPESKRIPLSPLVTVNKTFDSVLFTTVAEKVPADAGVPQLGQVLLQVPL